MTFRARSKSGDRFGARVYVKSQDGNCPRCHTEPDRVDYRIVDGVHLPAEGYCAACDRWWDLPG